MNISELQVQLMKAFQQYGEHPVVIIVYTGEDLSAGTNILTYSKHIEFYDSYSDYLLKQILANSENASDRAEEILKKLTSEELEELLTVFAEETVQLEGLKYSHIHLTEPFFVIR